MRVLAFLINALMSLAFLAFATYVASLVITTRAEGPWIPGILTSAAFLAAAIILWPNWKSRLPRWVTILFSSLGVLFWLAVALLLLLFQPGDDFEPRAWLGFRVIGGTILLFCLTYAYITFYEQRLRRVPKEVEGAAHN
jgi:hypothetical protein